MLQTELLHIFLQTDQKYLCMRFYPLWFSCVFSTLTSVLTSVSLRDERLAKVGRTCEDDGREQSKFAATPY